MTRFSTIRSLIRRPTYAAISIGLFTLAAGAVGTIAIIADAVFLRPMPYAHADRLRVLNILEPVSKDSTSAIGLAAPQLVSWRDQNSTFSGIGGYLTKSVTLTGDGEPQRLLGVAVSAELFRTLDVSPARGRAFTRDEETPTSNSVIISDGFWRRHFSADEHVLGRTVELDGTPHVVIGVMPASFTLFYLPTDVWEPMPLDASQMADKFRGVTAIGRLKPGVTDAQATADLDRICVALGVEIPAFVHSRGKVQPVRTWLFGSENGPMTLMFAAVLLLVIVATANGANLALSDAIARQISTATRIILGAPRAEVARTRAAEVGVSIAIATCLGLGLSEVALAVLRTVNPSYFDGFGPLGVNVRVALLVFGATAISSTLAMVPALVAEMRLDVSTLAGTVSRSIGGRRERRRRGALVGTQVAMAVILLASATLVANKLRELTRRPRGFEATGLVTVPLTMAPKYATMTDRTTYLTRVIDAVSAIPDVTSASASQSQFQLGSSSQTFLAIQGAPDADPRGQVSHIRHVMPGYFTTLKMRLLSGRIIGTDDRAGGMPVAVVNRAFERELLGGHALGVRMRRTARPEFQWMTVVGVVDDIEDAGLGVAVGPTVYVAYEQENAPSTSMAVLIRTRAPDAGVAPAVRAAIWGVDRDQALPRVSTLDQLDRDASSEPRFQSLIVALFGVAALLLVVGGVYAVTALGVVHRAREIGVRAAVGATPAVLVREQVWAAMMPVVLGGVVGIGAFFIAAPLASRLGLSVTATDSAGILAALAGVLVASGVAAFVPGLRAARVSPLTALRGG